MDEKEYKLLADVQDKCRVKPEFITHIINACVAGISSTEREMRQQAADMETMAVAMLALLKENRAQPALRKQMSELALSKLDKYYPNKTFMKWASFVITDT
jgi:hypothetical protein